MKTRAYQINLRNNIFSSYVARSSSLLALHDYNDERIKGLKFHIDVGDYFATIATILNLIGNALPRTSKKESELLKKMSEDLLYLQQHYKIAKKTA